MNNLTSLHRSPAQRQRLRGRRWLARCAGIALLAALQAGTAALAQPARVHDTIGQRLLACAACHGKEGRASSAGFFPRIAGKPAGYLYNQLVNFREGRRQYPLMAYMVDHMPDDYLQDIAQYFSSEHPPYAKPQPVAATPAVLERGKVLAVSGDKARNLPACIACHGERLTGMLPAIPGLLGLPRDYLNAQIGAWKNGARQAHAPDCMAQISQRLAADDISAISAWLVSQALPADMSPAPGAPIKLPLPCGSVPG